MKFSLSFEEYEVMEEEIRRYDAEGRRNGTTEQDMKEIEEWEKGADDPSNSAPLYSEFEGRTCRLLVFQTLNHRRHLWDVVVWES